VDLPTTTAQIVNEAIEPVTGPVVAAWATKGRRRFESFLNFLGLFHAPMNENGVVFLFGMMAQELGYVVESITPGFPECEAKRRVSKSGGNGFASDLSLRAAIL
jgi:hypothetical protein